MDVVERCRDAAQRLVAGRKVVLAGNPVAGFTTLVTQLRELGAEPVLIIGSGTGAGPLPDDEEARWVTTGATAANSVEEFRQMERIFADPPPHVLDELHAYDPDNEAILLVAPFQVTREIAGRRAYGPRRPEWVALEDKTACDEFFDAAGIPRPANEIVAASDRGALAAAHGRLDRGDGTVWSGDARDGFNGGGVFVRWIRDVHDRAVVDEALTFFAPRCDRIRVAPFLEGIPCSIHGIVTDEGVAVFRPVEMVTLRSPKRDPSRLRYAGVATYYDPPDVDREAMRAAARRAGKLLADRVDFRGCFGIDGVMTADGWLPTEMNPRLGAAVATLSRTVPELPLVLLHHLVAESGRLPVAPDELEDCVVAAADLRRAGGGWLTVERAWRESEEHDAPGGTLLVGPSAVGGFVRFILDPKRTPFGPSAAPLVARGFAHANEFLDAGIGSVEPARSVR